MKNVRMSICLLLILGVCLLTSCSSAMEETIIEMELNENYDTSDPFIHGKLFYVSDTIDNLKLEISFQMEGKSGLLEIADNKTNEVFWSDSWNGNIDNTTFSVSLDTLEKEKEYVIRFTGTKIKYTKIVITSKNKLVKERERPSKPNKN